MRPRLAALVAFIFVSGVSTQFALGQPAPAPTATTLVKVGRLLDVRSGRYSENQGILVEGERIKEVGPLTEVEAHVGKDALVVDLSKATVLPGLIDTHTHLLDARSLGVNFYEGALIRIVQGRQARQALWGAATAREMLQVGFTTVRDMGDSGGNGDAALRDAIEDGWSSDHI
ncbi:MAG: amidohydrolase family protein [Singulisphaera sp.]